jgi:F-box-like
MALPASSQLPDEIIKEILAPALHVSDEAFSHTADHEANPFASYGLSSSTILVVCKSWLRVATPLLYETVVLRSKAQAQALAGVLKANQQFGRFIRKLRVEGGYGSPVGEILRCSPLLTDLLIATTLYSNESIAGYLKGFQSVNPRRLIVLDDRLRTSAIRKKIYLALAEAVRHSWTNLVCSPPHFCEFCAHSCQTSFEMNDAKYWTERLEPLTSAVLEASKLEYFSFCSLETSIVRLANIPSLKEIRFITRYGDKPSLQALRNYPRHNELERLMRDDQSLYDKVIYKRCAVSSNSGLAS